MLRIDQAFGFFKLALALVVIFGPASFGGFYEVESPKDTKLFDVIYNGEKVGLLKAEKTMRKDRTTYVSSTRIKTTLLWLKKINVQYKYRVSYESEKLQSSKVKIKINKRKPERVTVHRSENCYLINSKAEERYTIEEPIEHSSILLYFEEPKNVARIFSERAGRFNTMEQIDEGLYRMINEKGDENLYHYTNGALSLIEVEGSIVSFEIRAQE